MKKKIKAKEQDIDSEEGNRRVGLLLLHSFFLV